MNNQLMLKELKCALCSNILSQPLELQCSALVCVKCLQEWIAATGAVNCPCCSEDGPLVSSHVRQAPGVILLLLSDVLVNCTDCSRDTKAGDYEGHDSVPSLTPEEEKQAAGLLKRAISTSPDKGIIQLPTGGTKIQGIVSGGEASALIQKEVLILSEEERRSLLDKAGISSSIELRAAQLTAISGDSNRQASVWLGEIAPFLFPIPSGGEELLWYTFHSWWIKLCNSWKGMKDKTGKCCFAAGDSVTNLHVALDRFNDQVEHLHGMKWRQYTVKVFICGDFEFLSKMYGLSGASGCYPCLYCKIHSDQMAIPLIVRGHAKERSLEDMYADHQCYVSSGSVKKDEQMFFNCISEPIFDIPVHRCSICWKLYACCQLDLELTSQITDFDSSSFSKYSQVLQRLPLFQADLETAQHAHEVLQQVATYVALVHGKKNPLAVDLLKQSAAKKRPVKALLAQEKLPHRSGVVAGQVTKFITAFSLYGKCHNICDQNFIGATQAHALDLAIQEFMAFFQDIPKKKYGMSWHDLPVF
eukprot:Em0009g169a